MSLLEIGNLIFDFQEIDNSEELKCAKYISHKELAW